ncbi:MAG: hypothetical protein ABUK01_03330 [Leptospirales bacterium]
MNNKAEKGKTDMVKTIKRMSRHEFLLKPSVAFKSKKAYRRKMKHKKSVSADS